MALALRNGVSDATEPALYEAETRREANAVGEAKGASVAIAVSAS